MSYDMFARVIAAIDYTLASAATRRDAKMIPATLATRDALFAEYPDHRDRLASERATKHTNT